MTRRSYIRHSANYFPGAGWFLDPKEGIVFRDEYGWLWSVNKELESVCIGRNLSEGSCIYTRPKIKLARRRRI